MHVHLDTAKYTANLGTTWSLERDGITIRIQEILLRYISMYGTFLDLPTTIWIQIGPCENHMEEELLVFRVSHL